MAGLQELSICHPSSGAPVPVRLEPLRQLTGLISLTLSQRQSVTLNNWDLKGALPS